MRAAIATFLSSFSLQLATVGVLFVVAGYLLRTGVWAGLLPIWGAALVAVGVIAYAVARHTYS